MHGKQILACLQRERYTCVCSAAYSACHTLSSPNSNQILQPRRARLYLILLHGILRDAGPARKLLAKELGRLCQLHAKHLQACTGGSTAFVQLGDTRDSSSENLEAVKRARRRTAK
jgi:hypothetical protein